MSSISKIISLLDTRGFNKEARLFEKYVKFKDNQCPICQDSPEPECIICDGTGEILSIAPDDAEDTRVNKELKLD